MKVMTFNLRTDFPLDIKNRWSKRKEIVYELIKNNNFDIIGVQELNNKMFNDIKSNILNYNIVGMPRSDNFFVERNDILVSKRHKVMEYNTFWLSKNPEKIGSSVWYSFFPRICTTALIKLEDGKLIRVYNTHLDFLLPRAREYGLKKIGEYIENQHKKDDYPAILMGDFNSSPNSKVIKNLIEGKYISKKFISVQESKKEIYDLSTLRNFNGIKKGLHIDYIFVTEEFNVKNSEIIYYNKEGRYPSDHYPISAEIDIKRKI